MVLQICGTAMGQKYAAGFANIFMANLDDEVLRNAKCKPLDMFRFIDDIFFVWTHSKMKWQSSPVYLTAMMSLSKQIVILVKHQ